MSPTRAVPVVTYTLMGLNVLAFLATFAQSRSIMNNQVGSSIFANWALNPGLVASGDWFRLVGSGFLHFGILHLAVNMYALYILGRDTEIVMGRSRYIGIYLVSLLGGSASVMAFQPVFSSLTALSWTAGASGAIFGIMGAQAVPSIAFASKPGPDHLGDRDQCDHQHFAARDLVLGSRGRSGGRCRDGRCIPVRPAVVGRR